MNFNKQTWYYKGADGKTLCVRIGKPVADTKVPVFKMECFVSGAGIEGSKTLSPYDNQPQEFLEKITELLGSLRQAGMATYSIGPSPAIEIRAGDMDDAARGSIVAEVMKKAGMDTQLPARPRTEESPLQQPEQREYPRSKKVAEWMGVSLAVVTAAGLISATRHDPKGELRRKEEAAQAALDNTFRERAIEAEVQRRLDIWNKIDDGSNTPTAEEIRADVVSDPEYVRELEKRYQYSLRTISDWKSGPTHYQR